MERKIFWQRFYIQVYLDLQPENLIFRYCISLTHKHSYGRRERNYENLWKMIMHVCILNTFKCDFTMIKEKLQHWNKKPGFVQFMHQSLIKTSDFLEHSGNVSRLNLTNHVQYIHHFQQTLQSNIKVKTYIDISFI